MNVLPITRLSLKEAYSRRLVLAGGAVSVVFIALFAVGFAFLFAKVQAQDDATLVVFAATLQTVLGLYVVHFLAGFLSLFLAVGAVSGEIDSGTLHAVLARPLRRGAWLFQRWLAFGALASGYVVGMAAALLLVARVIAGYGPVGPLRGIGLMVLEVLVLLSIGLLASTWWSTLAAGVVTFSLFGLAWLAGIVELVGDVVGNDGMRAVGVVVSLIVPSDALWRGASYYLSSPAFLAGATTAADGNPFTSVTPPATLLILWALGEIVVLLWLAHRRLQRRDL